MGRCKSEMLPIYIKPFEWRGEDEKDGYYFNIIGHNEKSETTMFRIRYCPWFYIGLDNDDEKTSRLITDIYSIKGVQSHEIETKNNMWGYNAGTKRVLRVAFHKLVTMYTCRKMLLAKKYECFEATVSPVWKFQTEKDFSYCEWLQANKYKAVDNQKSTCMNEYFVSPSSIEKGPDLGVPMPSVMSVDMEMNATNRNAMPKHFEPDDVIFCVGITFKKGKTLEKHAIVLEKANCKSGCVVHVVKDEKEMMDKFSYLVLLLDPDVIIGHNIFKWDFPYADERLKRGNYIWKPMSRYVDYEPDNLIDISWESSAYGEIEMKFPDCPGRIILDTWPFFQRGYKLPNYKLETIAQEFLKMGKNPVTPQEIFELYSHHNPDDLGIIVDYCIKDTELPLLLFDKVKIWFELVETSNVVRVSPMDLFTRGQGIRVFSQEYYNLHKRNYLVETRKVEKSKYEGGYVFQGIPGLYNHMFCFDFASLYPSIMISHNLCYTTKVADDDPISDDKCFVIAWEEEGKKYRYRWIKPEFHQGVLSNLEQSLALERKRLRKDMEPLEIKIKAGTASEEENLRYNVLDAKQKGIKVSMNSVYGDKGSHMSKLPCLEIAACTTFIGRSSIQKTAAEMFGETIYGDSVTGDTPILTLKDGQVDYVTISSLFSSQSLETEPLEGKQYQDIKGIQVWSDKGFTPIKYVMKHKYKGKLYRVITPRGMIDCTEDHSLLKPDGQEVKPQQVTIGDELLHFDLPFIGWKSEPIGDTKVEQARKFHYNQGRISLDENGSLVMKRNDSMVIQTIQELDDKEEYVYDIETNNHHFSAGVGQMVVHNTDSVMKQITGLDKHRRNVKELGEKLATKASKMFLAPMKLEFEKWFERFFFIQKKMYAGFLGDLKNPLVKLEDLTKEQLEKRFFCRGIPIARRDNCNFLRNFYKDVLFMIMFRKTREEILFFVETKIRHLIFRQVPFEDLIIIKKMGKNYKMESNPLAMFHSYMKNRGEIIEPGDRIDYVFVETDSCKKSLQGDKMQSPKFFHLDQNYLDVDYYLTNVVATPINKILSIAFPEIPPTYILKGMYPHILTRRLYLEDIRKGVVLKSVKK